MHALISRHFLKPVFDSSLRPISYNFLLPLNCLRITVLKKISCSCFLLQNISCISSMSSPEETSGIRVINVLCENSSLVAFKEGQEGYEQSMERAFNRSPSDKPNAFIKPRTADEVHHVLQYASTNHLQVSVLGGGHDPKGKLRSGFRVFPPSTT